MATGLDIAENTLRGLVTLLDLQLAGAPVHADIGTRADLVSGGTVAVPATLFLKGRRATGAAEDRIIENDGAVVDVDVSGRGGVLDVDFSRHDGLSEAEEGAELEQLHFGWLERRIGFLFFFLSFNGTTREGGLLAVWAGSHWRSGGSGGGIFSFIRDSKRGEEEITKQEPFQERAGQ